MFKIQFTEADVKNLNIFLNRVPLTGIQESMIMIQIVQKLEAAEPLKLVKKLDKKPKVNKQLK